MTDIDKLARELAYTLNIQVEYEPNIDAIKSALAAYGDECAKQMRDDAAELVEHSTASNCRPFNNHSKELSFRQTGMKSIARVEYANAIRALPLPSEVTK